MKVISLNVNGLRAASKKGLFEWLAAQDADVICLQEIKAHVDQLSESMRDFNRYHAYFMPAEKKGYSGVAIYSKQKPDKVGYGLGWLPADNEGRFLQLEFAELNIASIYLPSGSSGEHRQEQKFIFMDKFWPFLEMIAGSKKAWLLAGDWNIAHTAMDLKNWRANQKNSGFLPEERSWMSKIFDDLGLVDGFRHLYPEQIAYSWWSQRGQAYQKDVGWRIDYHVMNSLLAKSLISLTMERDLRFSDHAPLIAKYSL